MRLQKYLNLGAFFLVMLYLGCSPLVFYPLLEFAPVVVKGYPPGRVGIVREDVYFTAKDGQKLHAWYFPCAGATKSALVHHGRDGNVSYFLDTAYGLHAAGANVLLYDYEGYGFSEGQPSNANLCNDADTAYEFLVRQKHVRPTEIVEVGLSLGSGVACRMADQHPCAGLILAGAYTSLQRVAQKHIPFLRIYPSLLYPQPDLGVGTLFKEKRIPLLL